MLTDLNTRTCVSYNFRKATRMACGTDQSLTRVDLFCQEDGKSAASHQVRFHLYHYLPVLSADKLCKQF